MKTRGRGPATETLRPADPPWVIDALLLVGCVATVMTAGLSRASELPPWSDSAERLTVLVACVAIYGAVRTGPSRALAGGWALVTLGMVHGTVWDFVVLPIGATWIQQVLFAVGFPIAAAGVFLTRRSLRRSLESNTEAWQTVLHEEHRLHQIVEAAPLGCLLAEPGGTVRLANRWAHVVLGRAPETLVGYTVGELALGGETDSEGDEVRLTEVRYHHPDGSEREVELRTSPIQKTQGGADGSVMWLRDVTSCNESRREREQLRAQLRQNERLETLGTLTGGIAHDFNNLLAPIIGSTELARLDLAEDSPILEDLDLVRAAADRAKDLATQLLHLSRPEREEVQVVRLQETLHEALALLRASTGNRIEIVEQLDAQCPPILGTNTQLHQVFFNLCNNASHAMPGGGTITASLDLVDALATWDVSPPGDGPFVRARITDTGTGMEPETVERIFDPFFTTKGKDQGTGLGLAMAKSIVTSFQGTISVQSVVGQGTTFTVMFPAGRPDVAAADALPMMEFVGSGHILLVDDEEAVLRVTSRALWKLGFEVSPFRSSEEALGAFLKNPYGFDLVLSDYSMPGLTGLELLEKVRQAHADIPMVLTSGWVDSIPRDELARLGCALVAKPATPSQLGQAVARGLRTPVEV